MYPARVHPSETLPDRPTDRNRGASANAHRRRPAAMADASARSSALAICRPGTMHDPGRVADPAGTSAPESIGAGRDTAVTPDHCRPSRERSSNRGGVNLPEGWKDCLRPIDPPKDDLGSTWNIRGKVYACQTLGMLKPRSPRTCRSAVSHLSALAGRPTPRAPSRRLPFVA